MPKRDLDLFRRFTKRAKAAILHARDEAREARQSSLGPEYIFLGLVAQQEGVAGRVLARLGVALDPARQVIRSDAPGYETALPGEMPFSAEGKGVLELALHEARRLGHNYIGTEHLLLALFALDEKPETLPLRRVLDGFGLDESRVRPLLLQELGMPGRLVHPRWPLFAPVTGARSNVVMCRVGDAELDAIDTLVEAGVRATRSDAVAWLVRAGIDGNRALFDRLEATVREIRRLREQAQAISRDATAGAAPEAGPPVGGLAEEDPHGESEAGARDG